MGDIIIRKAKKDYMCDVCGHMIRTGEEYLDKVILHDGKAVRHERYHDECPLSDNEKINKFVSAFINVSSSIIAAEKHTGGKYTVVSIDCNKVVRLLCWDTTSMYKHVPLKDFVNNFNWE